MREFGIWNPKIKKYFFSKTLISRGNPEFGIRKNKKYFFLKIDFKREFGIWNPKIKKIFFSKTLISRGNLEFGIRKIKKIIFFDNSNSGVLVSKTSTRTDETQCISTLHCYNSTITPPDYVMECSGSWGNNKKPLQRLAGVDRIVGSQGHHQQ